MTTLATLKRRIRELEAASTPEARAVIRAAKRYYPYMALDFAIEEKKSLARAVARLIAKEGK